MSWNEKKRVHDVVENSTRTSFISLAPSGYALDAVKTLRHMDRRMIKMSALEEVIEKARNDPETKEHGAVVYFHRGVGRHVYFCDHRLKVDYAAKIMPGD